MNKRFFYIISIGFFLIICKVELKSSQIINNLSYGISAEYNIENHTINKLSLPEISYIAPNEFSANGNNINFSIDFLYNLDDFQSLAFSTSYSFRSINSAIIQNEIINLDSTAILGKFEHNFNFNSQAICLKLEYKYEFNPSFGLGTLLKYNFNIDNDFFYKQVLVYPVDRAYFIETGTRTRNKLNGNLQNFSIGNFSAGIFVYKEYPLSIDNKIVAIPKIGYSHSLLYLDKFSFWTYHSYFVTISILYK